MYMNFISLLLQEAISSNHKAMTVRMQHRRPVMTLSLSLPPFPSSPPLSLLPSPSPLLLPSCWQMVTYVPGMVATSLTTCDVSTHIHVHHSYTVYCIAIVNSCPGHMVFSGTVVFGNRSTHLEQGFRLYRAAGQGIPALAMYLGIHVAFTTCISTALTHTDMDGLKQCG